MAGREPAGVDMERNYVTDTHVLTSLDVIITAGRSAAADAVARRHVTSVATSCSRRLMDKHLDAALNRILPAPFG